MSTLKTNAIQTVAGKPILNSTGSILQVVSATSNTSSTTTSTTHTASTLFADITPSSTSSKILIMLHTWSNVSGTNVHNWITIYRNDSINLASTGNMTNLYAASGTESPQSLIWLDSPASTSSTRYRLYFRSQSAGIAVGVGGGRDMSMVLMEVSG